MEGFEKILNVLFDGTRQEISKLQCPNCKGTITYSFAMTYHSGRIMCEQCGIIESYYKFDGEPNCIKWFGESTSLPKE